MSAKYILAGLAALFLMLALARIGRRGHLAHPQSRTWLIIAIIFGAVGTWLFYQGPPMERRRTRSLTTSTRVDGLNVHKRPAGRLDITTLKLSGSAGQTSHIVCFG